MGEGVKSKGAEHIKPGVASPSPVETDGSGAHPGPLIGLMIAALGVVFGDIGTSPLYSVKECFHGIHAIPVTPANVYGVVSLILWSLIMVVSIKYVFFIMRASNRGEGGIFALLALIPEAKGRRFVNVMPGVTLGAIFGASLLYGDGIITPAISVLSAVEGLHMATTFFDPYIVPITCVILFFLFNAQKHGTARVGRVFGPVMIVWFVTLGVLGISYAVQHPQILAALSPHHGVNFFARNGYHGFVVLGSVFLAVTGGEALYADMGHFGARPMRRAWFMLVLPGLMLNYFGQGALLLENPAAAVNPFYGLVPEFLLYPMVLLSSSAAVIASQTLITGAYSLTRQAIQLGYFPRMRIVHTSGTHEGQIYMPIVNGLLMVLCIGLVLAFRSSSKLAAAYGLAAATTMALTSILYFFVTTRNWKWPVYKALPLTLIFLTFDLAFFGSNLLKFLAGGWFPVVIALSVTGLMTSWKLGRKVIGGQMVDRILPFNLFMSDVAKNKVHRIKGTAVFMSYSPEGTPPVLLHHLKHNQVLHEKVVLLTIITMDDRPKVAPSARLLYSDIGHGFYRLVAHFGYMESPDVPELLREAHRFGLITDPATTTYYLGREALVLTLRKGMTRWRKILFAFMSRNEEDASKYFELPPRRVVELGMQVEL